MGILSEIFFDFRIRSIGRFCVCYLKILSPLVVGEKLNYIPMPLSLRVIVVVLLIIIGRIQPHRRIVCLIVNLDLLDRELFGENEFQIQLAQIDLRCY